MQNFAQTTDNTTPQLQEANNVVLGESDDFKDGGDTIYFPLEAILDLRMATLAKINPELAVKVLNTGTYHKRVTDNFEGVDKEVYREAYAKRDLDTLKLSVVTNLVFFLRRIIKDSLISSVMNQKVEKLCFTVNVYPFDFSDPGLVEMLINCIRFHTYSTSSVKIVSIADEELTPEYCGANFQIMILYDWVKWVDKHREFFQARGIPGTAVVVPEIFYDEAPTQEDIDRLNMRKHNPFRLNEELLRAMFRLKYMPVSLFSMHEAINKNNAAQIAQRVEVTQQDIEEYLDNNYPKATVIQDTPLPNVNLDEAFELL